MTILTEALSLEEKIDFIKIIDKVPTGGEERARGPRYKIRRITTH